MTRDNWWTIERLGSPPNLVRVRSGKRQTSAAARGRSGLDQPEWIQPRSEGGVADLEPGRREEPRGLTENSAGTTGPRSAIGQMVFRSGDSTPTRKALLTTPGGPGRFSGKRTDNR